MSRSINICELSCQYMTMVVIGFLNKFTLSQIRECFTFNTFNILFYKIFLFKRGEA